MSAKYVMQEVKDLNEGGEKTLLYPRMVIGSSCSTEELVSFVTQSHASRASEMKGAIELLAEGLACIMAQGRSVRIDGLGLFTPRLVLREGREREDVQEEGGRRNAQSIRIGGVSFRPDKELLRKTERNCHLERVPGKTLLHVSKYTPEERLGLAQRYLDENAVLTVSAYAALTGLSRTVAGRELRRWYETEGSGIGISGRGTHRVYIRRKTT